MSANVREGCDTKPSPLYRSSMAEADRSAYEEPAVACGSDDAFHQRLAASMKRHRRILDRLAGESG